MLLVLEPTMLNNEVCKKCWDYGWSRNDEEDWVNLRQVECLRKPLPYDGELAGPLTYINIDDPPPPECPRKFEHAVAAGSVNIDKEQSHE
jgi:hypothetical protein